MFWRRGVQVNRFNLAGFGFAHERWFVIFHIQNVFFDGVFRSKKILQRLEIKTKANTMKERALRQLVVQFLNLLTDI